MSAKPVNYLWFLAIGILLLFNPLVGSGQNNAATNLAGSSWDTGVVGVPSSDVNFMTTLVRVYDFGDQGKVKSTLSRIRSQVVVPQQCGYESGNDYDASGKMVFATRYVCKPGVIVPPTEYSEVLNGTYKITGNSIYLSFPAYTVKATIYGDSMKGLLTYTGTNELESWVISNATNSSRSALNGGQITKPVGPSPPTPLSGAILTKYNPTRLMSNTISGRINTANGYLTSEKKEYYRFWAGPGEIKITASLASQRNEYSYFGTLMHVLYYDSGNFAMPAGSGLTYVGGGQTNTTETKIILDSKKELLLELNENARDARFSIQLAGPIDLNYLGAATITNTDSPNNADAISQSQELIRQPRNSEPVANIRSAAIANSYWDFNLNIDRLVGNDGQIRNELHNFKWTVHFDVDGENIVGKIVSATGDRGEPVCADADIKGTLKGRELVFRVTYRGACCTQGQMMFFGSFDFGTSTSVKGTLTPSGSSASASCSLAYANVTAIKRR